MSDVLARAAGLFVTARPAAAPRRPDPDVIVLGRTEHALPVAAGLAAARGGLVAAWPACELLDAAAFPRARARAQRLDGAGFAVVARGRVAFALLPADPRQAHAALVRLADLTRSSLVTAICGPRPAGLDSLLAAHDVAVVVAAPGADPDILAAATAGLSRLVPDTRLASAPSGPARLAALSGLLATPLPAAGALAPEAR